MCIWRNGEFTLHSPTLHRRHNKRDGVSNPQPNDCLLNRLFRRRSKKTSKLRVTGLCAGNSPLTGEFPAQKASDGENVAIWWRHHEPYNVTKVIWPMKYLYAGVQLLVIDQLPLAREIFYPNYSLGNNKKCRKRPLILPPNSNFQGFS